MLKICSDETPTYPKQFRQKTVVKCRTNNILTDFPSDTADFFVHVGNFFGKSWILWKSSYFV